VRIDLNSDLGEGAGADAEIMPLITSANIACGAHAGDEATMEAAIALALRHGVAIGAHPGYRDAANFGRVPLDIPAEALRVDIRAQLVALRTVAERAGAHVTRVKAHGALYNQGEREEGIAATIAQAVADVDPELVLVAPPGSAMARAAERAGLRVCREGFIDRAYEPDGRLRSRRLDGALITDPAAAAAQALSFVVDGGVVAQGGRFLALEVDTLCVHGDTPGAPAILRAVRAALVANGVAVRGT
jgi:UPF0271 protein